ncbi:MAG: hypothetical protein EA365_07305 [Gloeocapsa sp. DLM2.Bin57]|nr:MAG: hypothetical protein EA365_07305 [Gloeocapsa sp. DLM2.Bin57]
MLYLAQAKNSCNPDSIILQLIAYQESNLTWSLCHPEIVIIDNLYYLNEGVLVLVNLDENENLIDIKEAKDWVLNLVNLYLNSDKISPESLEQEKQRLEEWRRELTAKNQEITQTRLELETRLEQLQELEENLKKLIKQQE